MIPFWAMVRVSSEGHRLWLPLPLFLLWLLLLPLALLLFPVFALACVFVRVNPFPAAAAIFGLIAATRGARIEITSEHTRVLVCIH